MRKVVLLFAPLLMAQAAPQPLVPEGIHRPATEQPHLCGFTAASVDALQQKITSDPSFHEHNSNERYRVFNREADFVQFVFPRPGFLSFPMATCMHLTQASDGTVNMSRQLHCAGTRDECDRIFVQWNDHDNEVRRGLASQRQ